MKIAIDCRMLNNSGIGNVLKNILNNLPTIHEYLLIGNEKDLLIYKSDKIMILPCNINIFSLNEFFNFPVKEINKCDVFFTPNYNIPGKIQIPKCCFIHDLVYLDMPELTSKVGFIIRYLYALRSVLISKAVFTVSDFSKNRIIHYFGHKDKIKKITVTIPLAFKEYIENPHNLKKKSTEKYFLFVGNVKKHKGLETLINAFKLLNDVTVKLYIVGKKDSFKTNFISVLEQDNPNIIFTGYLNDNELFEYEKTAMALIQPSFYEGFGSPPLEALYLDTPVILSDITVFKEIYGCFPITFFECGNSDDLEKRMRNVKTIEIDKKVLDTRFDFKPTMKIIFDSFEKRENNTGFKK